MRTTSALLPAAFDNIERRYSNDQELPDLPTGLMDLDMVIHGLHPKTLVIIGGRPSIGRTALMLKMLDTVIQTTDVAAAFISYRNAAEEMLSRLIIRRSKIPRTRLINKSMNSDDWSNMAQSLGALQNVPLYVGDYHDYRRSISAVRKLKKKSPGLKVVFVEGIDQIIESLRQRERACRAFRELATELDLCVVLTVLASRAVENRTNRRPLVCDIAESEWADVVLFVHKEAYYNYMASKSDAEIIIARNKFGTTCTIEAIYDIEHGTFTDKAVSVPGIN